MNKSYWRKDQPPVMSQFENEVISQSKLDKES